MVLKKEKETKETKETNDSKYKEIDLVYCWCGLPETDLCRYVEDLTYSIKSVQKNMTWIRNIVVAVSDDFATLKEKERAKIKENAKIKIVYHSEFIPKKYLTNLENSNVIESWIWKIQGLSECFLYMNDDMYIGQPVTPDLFFESNSGMPILRHEPGATHHPKLSELSAEALRIPYVRMWSNAVEKYGIDFTRIAHQVQPYRISLLQKQYKQFKKVVDEASTNKQRSGEKDFNLLRFSTSMAVQSGSALLRITDLETMDYFTESDDLKRIRRLLTKRPVFFCINNTGPQSTVALNTVKKYFNV
jgi:UDP-glucose 4-epimerase